MATYEADDVRSLRVGDRIRILGMPIGCDEPNYTIHRDTRRLFKRLIARKRPLVIDGVDEWGMPWIKCQYPEKGKMMHHSLALSDVDQWVRVRPKK